MVLTVILASGLAGSFAYSFLTSPIPTWTSTIVDSSGGGVSAAVGPAGEVLVGYSTGVVRVASSMNGVWETAYSDMTAQPRAFSTAIAVDHQGYFHIAYTYEPADHSYPPSLRSVTNRGGTLALRAFAANSILPSIAVDSNRTAHIAFFYGMYEADEPGIGYVTDASSAEPVIRIVPTEPWSRKAIRVAVGPSNEVYIGAALDVSEGGVGYFTREISGWQFHQLENVSVAFQGLALAVDPFGAIHMAYAISGSPDSPAVRYATNRTGTWSLTTIPGIGAATARGAASYLSISLDRSGHVHLLGIGPRPMERYETIVYATDTGGTWATFSVATVRLAEFAGTPISLAVTSNDRVHVLYTSEGDRVASLIDLVNVPGTVALADVLPRWGAVGTGVALATGAGLFAVWLVRRVARYRAFRSEGRRWAAAKLEELKTLRRGPP